MIAESVKETPMGRLMQIMNLSGAPYELEAVCKTSDGFYMGQIAGDLGYNVFIGKPAAPHPGPGLKNALAIWEKFTKEQKQAVSALAQHMPDGGRIDLVREFGIEE